MKQYITIDQVNELSETGKFRLIMYLFPGDYYGDVMERVGDIPKIMSIGRMIEFIRDSGSIDCGNPYDGGFIDYTASRDPDARWYACTGGYHYSAELCDALWKAVKEILERQ